MTFRALCALQFLPLSYFSFTSGTVLGGKFLKVCLLLICDGLPARRDGPSEFGEVDLAVRVPRLLVRVPTWQRPQQQLAVVLEK